MKSFFKKEFIFFLSLLLAFAMLITGCGNNAVTTPNKPLGEGITENSMPISEEGITLTLWCRNSSQGYVKSFNDYESFKRIEEITGIKIEFIHPTGVANEQLNIILASGDYPDIMNYYFDNDMRTLKAYQEGIFIPLGDYVDKYAPNFKKLITENASYKHQVDSMGAVLSFPCLRDDERFMAYDGYFIRQDWLDKVGLSVPETIEEWETVLKAFRDNDVAGGGKTVPFATIGGTGGSDTEVFAGAFGFSLFANFISPITGKISHPMLEPGFKDYLTTMHRWYNEGLLDKSFFSATPQQIDSMVLNDELGSMYINNNNAIPKYLQVNPDLALTPVPFPKDKEGKRYHTARLNSYGRAGSVVTSACKYPVEAVRYLDYLYTKEASDLMYWGVEGESYTAQSDGTYKFTDLILKDPDGKTPYEAINKYMTNTGFTGLHQYHSMVGLESNFSDKFKTIKNQSVEYSMETDKSLLNSYLPFTYEELTELSEIGMDLNNYVTEMRQKFIMGYEPISNFDEFVSQAKQLGLERTVEIRQQAYDRIPK